MPWTLFLKGHFYEENVILYLGTLQRAPQQKCRQTWYIGNCLHGPWSLPWCPWNAPVEIYSCPLPRKKCLGALALALSKTKHTGLDVKILQWKGPFKNENGLALSSMEFQAWRGRVTWCLFWPNTHNTLINHRTNSNSQYIESHFKGLRSMAFFGNMVRRERDYTPLGTRLANLCPDGWWMPNVVWNCVQQIDYTTGMTHSVPSLPTPQDSLYHLNSKCLL